MKRNNGIITTTTTTAATRMWASSRLRSSSIDRQVPFTSIHSLSSSLFRFRRLSKSSTAESPSLRPILSSLSDAKSLSTLHDEKENKKGKEKKIMDGGKTTKAYSHTARRGGIYLLQVGDEALFGFEEGKKPRSNNTPTRCTTERPNSK